MSLHPIMLEMKDRRCVVVGAGAVGTRRARALAEAGARVLLVAPEISDEPEGVETCRKAFCPEVLDAAELVLACTDDPEVNDRVAREARSRGLWVSRSDEPSESDFHMPMHLRQGPVLLAVSTGGASPTLARRIRDSLTLPPQLGEYAQALLDFRNRAKAEIDNEADRADIMRQLGSEQAFMLFLRDGPDALKTLYETQRKRNHKQADAL
jgi:siroheme synthase-like protein